MKKFLFIVLCLTAVSSLSSCIGCDESDMDSMYEGFKDGYYGEDRTRNQW